MDTKGGDGLNLGISMEQIQNHASGGMPQDGQAPVAPAQPVPRPGASASVPIVEASNGFAEPSASVNKRGGDKAKPDSQGNGTNTFIFIAANVS